MCSSSPARTPKLQLTAEQPSTGKCWIPPKKYTPYPGAKKKPQQDGRRGEITFRIKTYNGLRCSEGSNKTLCARGNSRDRARPVFECLSVSCEGTSQKWTAARAGPLGAADLGMI